MTGKLSTGIGLLRANISKTPYIVLYVTNRCDLSCPFCFNRDIRHQTSDAVGAAEYLKLARSVRHPFELLISGGEPFLREDLADILLGFIRYSRPAVITIPTNGSQTARIGRVLEAIRTARFKGRIHINLSIDGPGEEHDCIRGSSGLHRKIIETAGVIREHKARNPNLWLGVISVAGDHNHALIEPLIGWVRDKIAPDIHDIGLERGYVDRTDPERVIAGYAGIRKMLEALNPSRDIMEIRLFNAVMQYMEDSLGQGRPADGCRAGRTITVITADGKVYPCEPFWISPDAFPNFERTCLGDLRDHGWNLPALLGTAEAQAIIAKIGNRECRCFWECALFANLLFTHRGWIRIGRAMLRRNTSV